MNIFEVFKEVFKEMEEEVEVVSKG